MIKMKLFEPNEDYLPKEEEKRKDYFKRLNNELNRLKLEYKKGDIYILSELNSVEEMTVMMKLTKNCYKCLQITSTFKGADLYFDVDNPTDYKLKCPKCKVTCNNDLKEYCKHKQCLNCKYNDELESQNDGFELFKGIKDKLERFDRSGKI